MATQDQLASFVQRRVSLGRVQPGTNYWIGAYYAPPMAYFGPQLPTAETVARSLLADAEFRALQLGGLLSTPQGEFLEQAVELVLPRTIAPEFEILVEALKLATQWQQVEARDTAGTAVLAVGGTVLAAVFLNELIKAVVGRASSGSGPS